MCPTLRCEVPAERIVRSVLHRLGYRFRLQRGDLPGCPEVVLPRWRLALFIVDCGRHPHSDCSWLTDPLPPAAETEAEAERRRLASATARLEREGWQTLIVQACEADDPEALGYRLDIALQGRLIASTGRSPDVG